jgi:hypothetical protein
MNFPTKLAPALDRVLANCKGANPNFTAEAPQHPDDTPDVLAVQSAMALIGVTLTYGEAHNLWDLVSLDNQEVWSKCSERPEDVLISVQVLCEHVADSCDYAGISRPMI